MPTDRTRRLLKVFGVAVTGFEDAVEERRPLAEIAAAEAEARARLQEVADLIEKLIAKKQK